MASDSERLAKLERTVAAMQAPDSVADNFISVTANGNPTASFEGHIKALGIDLPEERAAGLYNAIQWFDSLNRQRGIIREFSPEKGEGANTMHVLDLYSAGLVQTADLQVRGSDNIAETIAEVMLNAHSFSATIADSLGRSSFLQLVSVLNRKIAFGITSVNFTASTTSSTSLVSHGLGKLALVVVGNPQLGVLSSADFFEFTTTTFKVTAFSQPALTLTATIPWIALG